MRELACRLDALGPEERVRRTSLLADFRGAVTSVKEMPDGYELRLAPDRSSRSSLQELIGLEGRCCPFLSFELLGTNRRPGLRITGGPGVTELIRREFVPDSPDP